MLFFFEKNQYRDNQLLVYLNTLKVSKDNLLFGFAVLIFDLINFSFEKNSTHYTFYLLRNRFVESASGLSRRSAFLYIDRCFLSRRC